jgi:hypothetical protein
MNGSLYKIRARVTKSVEKGQQQAATSSPQKVIFCVSPQQDQLDLYSDFQRSNELGRHPRDI